jgi:hypothetical protein
MITIIVLTGFTCPHFMQAACLIFVVFVLMCNCLYASASSCIPVVPEWDLDLFLASGFYICELHVIQLACSACLFSLLVQLACWLACRLAYFIVMFW